MMCERYINHLPLAHPHLGTWPKTQECSLAGNRTNDSSVCRLALNPMSYNSQGRNKSFQKHEGKMVIYLIQNLKAKASVVKKKVKNKHYTIQPIIFFF